jgi:NADH-quinone oxidoreductase subunit J
MQALIFYICAVAVIGGALGVILSRNPVHSALFLLATLVSVAILFLQLDAGLVAAVQVVVYASAIVVLFVFVITLLGVDKQETLDEPSLFQRPVAIGLGVLLFLQIVLIAGHHWVTGQHSARGALSVPRTGNVVTLARSLFTDFVWAFEITAVLLVIAVVGGVALARRSGQRAGGPPGEPTGPGTKVQGSES